ncbi:glucosyltransferase [Gordonia phage Phendrix]|uniref:Glycosyltransferase n=2 Tax=Godonkavirus TaxID=2733178 RepID=A0A4D6E2G5_9CAUD|nr:glucosyltransferase [Gordonia phage GodonK]YP_010649124.1 glucosyltransferase [Gordonia phage Phendrix]QBZ72701.1 glycosyltransferase [Gordonia phage GodonK]QDK02628.1 glycosyltransferase [Gordonia phage Phendrix]
MTEISYVVVGDSRRARRAYNLAGRLGASVALDLEGKWGPGINHRRAWILGNTEKCDWIVVMEDDAILCTNFLEKAEKALVDAPTDIVSFYLGTGYPLQHQSEIRRRVAIADETDASWIQMRSMNHAVCIAMKQELVTPMLDHVATSRKPIDEAIGKWARTQQILVSYPVESLVDHADEETLIKHPDGIARTKPRRAIRFAG